MLEMLRRKNGKIDMILVVSFIMTLCYYVTYPTIWYYVYQAITPEYISVQNIVSEVSCIVFSLLWRKYADKLYTRYPWFLAAEFVTSMITIILVWIVPDLKFYFIVNTIGIALTSNNIACGGRKLRARRYPSENERNDFDQMDSVMTSAGIIIGSAIGACVQSMFTAQIMITIALSTGLLDNLCYYFIFRETEATRSENAG